MYACLSNELISFDKPMGDTFKIMMSINSIKVTPFILNYSLIWSDLMDYMKRHTIARRTPTQSPHAHGARRDIRRRRKRGRGGRGAGPPNSWSWGYGGHAHFWAARPAYYMRARLRDHVVQIMASQRTLDAWLPADKKKKTASDRRKKYTPCNVTRLRMEEVWSILITSDNCAPQIRSASGAYAGDDVEMAANGISCVQKTCHSSKRTISLASLIC